MLLDVGEVDSEARNCEPKVRRGDRSDLIVKKAEGTLSSVGPSMPSTCHRFFQWYSVMRPLFRAVSLPILVACPPILAVILTRILLHDGYCGSRTFQKTYACAYGGVSSITTATAFSSFQYRARISLRSVHDTMWCD